MDKVGSLVVLACYLGNLNTGSVIVKDGLMLVPIKRVCNLSKDKVVDVISFVICVGDCFLIFGFYKVHFPTLDCFFGVVSGKKASESNP